jgi:hypothetical protein
MSDTTHAQCTAPDVAQFPTHHLLLSEWTESTNTAAVVPDVSAHLMSLGSAFTRPMLPQPEPSTTTRGLSRATVPSSCLRTLSSRGLGEDTRCAACFCAAGLRSATCCQ